MTAPNVNSPVLWFYRDENGWHTDRNWNEHPATAEELEDAFITLQALNIVGLQLVHHIAKKQLVIADGIDPADELAVAQCLVRLRDLVWPDAPENKEASDDAGAG